MKLTLLNESPRPTARPGHAYRGMKLAEWEIIQQTGQINSRGWHNVYDHQQGGTCYGDIESAIHYAAEVPIYNDQTDGDINDHVGVVIEVPVNRLLSHGEHPGVHQGEYMHFGPLPATHISRAWFLSVTNVDMGPERPEHVDQRSGLTVPAMRGLINKIEFDTKRIV